MADDDANKEVCAIALHIVGLRHIVPVPEARQLYRKLQELFGPERRATLKKPAEELPFTYGSPEDGPSGVTMWDDVRSGVIE